MEILVRHFDFCPAWYSVGLDREKQNAGEPPSTSINRELTTNIVAAYDVRRNQIGLDQLGTLISTVYQALSGLGTPAAELRLSEPPPCRSGDRFMPITSFALECGWRGQMLRRHLATGHELSVDQYRARHEPTEPFMPVDRIIEVHFRPPSRSTGSNRGASQTLGTWLGGPLSPFPDVRAAFLRRLTP